ncbi:hypothetical protein FB567DRAFT_588369 [Paraphoma chrysanthemicola]|uniref:Uncharacterized protein n=1 Tax=Paraphoma chrysanthemicola TaxID=798071 RepID=A0A8K0W2D0_9PLEO|nr:hypothetical protein FB567DRAFT_588369 [Paraphoma chrysanthemicola]
MSPLRISSTNHRPTLVFSGRAVPLSALPTIVVADILTSHLDTPNVEIWIGYTKNGRHYIDKQVKAPTAEQQMRALKWYYNSTFTSFERFAMRWMYCQIPIIQIGELHHPCLQNDDAHGTLPREVQFASLETDAILSASFARPDLLQEYGNMFHDTHVFNVKPPPAGADQRVLCISHTVDKKLLIIPLMFTIIVAITVAVVVIHLTRSVAAGAEVGSFVGVILSLMWAYILWLSG